MSDGSSLPQELDACHRLIEQLSSQLERQARELQSRDTFVEEQSRTVVDLEASHQQLSDENEGLKLAIRKLLDRLYGRRSERFISDPNQILIDFGDDAAAAAEALAEAVLEVGDSLRVRPDTDLLDALRSLLGSERVRLDYQLGAQQRIR